MVSNKDVFSYLKGNLGEESTLKLLVMSAFKSLVSVVIIIAAIIAYLYLLNRFGITALLFLTSYTFFMILICTGLLGSFHDGTRIALDNTLYDYRKWKDIFRILDFKKLLYFDWHGNNVDIGEQITVFIISAILSAVLIVVLYCIGFAIIVFLAFIYAFILSFNAPPESMVTVVTVSGSILLMSMLFIKLKWRKIFRDNKINLNLIAWCICAAIIITVISFVAGVAIRRIAGYIGIEYTIGLISIYIIVTAIYVINDLKQWMDNKARETARLDGQIPQIPQTPQ